jgi:hypothetical protein
MAHSSHSLLTCLFEVSGHSRVLWATPADGLVLVM